MRTRRADLGLLVLLFGWTGLLLALTLIAQKGLYLPETRALLRLAWALAIAALWWAAAVGLGLALVSRLRLPPADRWLAAALVGSGALGLAWLLVGLVRLPPAWLTPLLLALPLPLLWRARGTLPRPPRLHPLTAAWLAATLLFSLLVALQPTHSFDALLYHIRLPQLWLEEGSLRTTVRASSYYYPVLVEAQMVPAMQLAGERAAAVVAWGFFPLLLALVARLTRHFLPAASLNLTLLLVGSIQMVPLLASWAYSDVALALYQLAALWAFLQWDARPRPAWLILAGAFAAMAMNVKYLAFLTPLLLALLVLLRARRDALRPLLLLTLVTTAVALPSYLRNSLGTGNPTFPFALPSPYWDSFRAAWYSAEGTGAPLSALLAAPLLLMLGTRDLSYFDARPGPLILGLAPLALWFLLRRAGATGERRVVGLLVAASMAYVALWLIGAARAATLWQGRFLLQPFVLLAPPIAWAAARLEGSRSAKSDPAGLVRLLAGLWAAIALLIQGAEWARSEPLAALLYSPSAWRQRHVVGSLQSLGEAMATLPPDSRSILLMEPRSYGTAPTTLPDILLYEFPWRLWRADGDLRQLTATLCDEGFTHAAISWRGVGLMRQLGQNQTPLSDAELAQLRAWRNSQTLLWQGRDQGGQLDHQLLQLSCPAGAGFQPAPVARRVVGARFQLAPVAQPALTIRTVLRRRLVV